MANFGDLGANTGLNPNLHANAGLGAGYHYPANNAAPAYTAPVAACPWNNTSAILVLFVLLVIITRTMGAHVLRAR